MGPDLSNIGGSSPLAVIRESILEPSKKLMFLGNEGATVTLKSGKTIQGIARNRDNYSLQIIDDKGELHLLSMHDVKELKVLDRSPMPGDYLERLSADELRDLVAYLARQVARPRAAVRRANN